MVYQCGGMADGSSIFGLRVGVRGEECVTNDIRVVVSVVVGV